MPSPTAPAVLANQKKFLVNLDELSMYQYNFDENSSISLAMKRFFAEEEAKSLDIETAQAFHDPVARRL